VLSHSAGLAGWDVPIEPEDFLDHDKLVGLLAAQAPWWEPGTAPGYHAISQGYLLGEIVERITGRSLGTFFAEEIAGPLGADFHIGTGPEHDARIAHVIPPAVPSLVAADADPDSIAYRAMSNGSLDASFSQRHDWRRAEIPAAGGHGNARSVATVHTPTACGGTANGVTILSPEGVDRIFDEQVHGMDLVLGIDVRHGMGYGLPTTEMPFPHERTCFWGLWGGSLAIIDTESRLSFSYVMNKMGDGTTGDMRGFNLLVHSL
jgi:CubicO group peptidase (beta-lactamase class C family)